MAFYGDADEDCSIRRNEVGLGTRMNSVMTE
jgi:hypothetical protein